MRCLNSAPQESMFPAGDQRGKIIPANKKDKDKIFKHIQKYNPAVHHYRREHAPNRLYLPSDITVVDMHADYVATEEKISLETYRKCVKEKNISFSILGQEECEKCKQYVEHKKLHKPEDNVNDCERCVSHIKHLKNRDAARSAYKKDAELNLRGDNKDNYYGSVDLQKVIMLPRMTGVKTCAFTRRIIAFNETFAELGKAKSNVVVLWNESVGGRSASEICSAFWNFLINKVRDTKQVTLWCDNCTSQNKNWTMFSFLVFAVNSNLIAAETIEFKYLVSGHTFMPADSVHHQIEQGLKKHGDVCDWVELKAVLAKAKCEVIDIEAKDFVHFMDGSNRPMLTKAVPRIKLAEMSRVLFQRGSRAIKYKTSHSVDDEYKSVDFLKKFNMKIIPSSHSSPRGVPTSKREDIVKKLCPLMPASRRVFWEQLPTNDNSDDLISFV